MQIHKQPEIHTLTQIQSSWIHSIHIMLLYNKKINYCRGCSTQKKCELPVKIPKEGGSQQSYPVMTPVNYSSDQCGNVTLRCRSGTLILIVTNSSLIGFKICSTRWKSCLVLETQQTNHGPQKRTSNCFFTKPTQYLTTFLIVVFILTDKCSSHPSARKFLFAIHQDYYRKPQWIKRQSCDAPSPLIHLHHNFVPKAQRSLNMKWWKSCKSQRNCGFAV